MPIDDLDDDGYPNDWFVPPSSRAAQPSDWTYPANWIAAAPPATPGTAQSFGSPQPNAANPTPVNPAAALRPDPLSLVQGSDSLGMPWNPPTFPDAFSRFPPTPLPPLTFPQATPTPGLFGFVPEQPTYGLFKLTLTPTGPVAPLSISKYSSPQGPSGTPSGMQPIPNFSSSPFSNPAFQTNPSFTDPLSWTSALGNPLDPASTPPVQLPMGGSFSSLGPTALFPTDFSPIANPQPVSFANQGNSPEPPASANGDPLAKILNLLNPISPAYAAGDEDEIPPAELEALLHLLNPEIAQRLIEQNRFWEDYRRDLEEVRAGRPSSRALARYLETSGVNRPPGYEAHHIVAGTDPPAEFARGVLKRFGIGINDAVNGVFLPANKATQIIAGKTIHASLHSNAYYEAVNEALRPLTTRQQVIDKLRSIAQALEAGDFP